MKRRYWFGIAGATLALLGGARAGASISRTAIGRYVWSNVKASDASGRVFKTFGTDANVPVDTSYVDTVGRYGGGDNESGRLTAKRRAISLADNCTWTLYTYGTSAMAAGVHTYTRWQQACGLKPTNPDVVVESQRLNYGSVTDMIQTLWCPVARSAATQARITGTIYLQVDVNFWGDASGSEADTRESYGNLNMIPCDP